MAFRLADECQYIEWNVKMFTDRREWFKHFREAKWILTVENRGLDFFGSFLCQDFPEGYMNSFKNN